MDQGGKAATHLTRVAHVCGSGRVGSPLGYKEEEGAEGVLTTLSMGGGVARFVQAVMTWDSA
jgi:hypothetical protein